MSLFMPGTRVRPVDPRHLWRLHERECLIEGTYLSKRFRPNTKERRVVLGLWVEGFSLLIYQWAEDFEVVNPTA